MSLLKTAKEVLEEGKGRAELIRRCPGTTIWQARKALNAARDVLKGKHGGVGFFDPILRTKALKLLKKGVALPDLADTLWLSEKDSLALIKALGASGYAIQQVGRLYSIAGVGTSDIVVPTIKAEHEAGGGTIKFGFISDTHLCSRHQRLDVLTYAYDEFKRRGIQTVFHAGNVVDGESRVNQHDLIVHGIAEQAQYVLDHYPKRDGVTTYYIDADDHEGWWRQREGIEFGKYLANEAKNYGRDDLKYIGYMESDISVKVAKGQCIIRIMHPGGGSSYAYSYTSQKLAESFGAGEKPAILLVGHFHKADYCLARHIHVVQGGCCQDQSTFMRKKRLEAHVGFWIISVTLDINGAVTRFVPEFYPFFDRGYYVKRDDLFNMAG